MSKPLLQPCLPVAGGLAAGTSGPSESVCGGRNALLMNALSTPSHLPSRQNSSRIPSAAEMTAEEELRSARPETFSQQVSPLCPGYL